LLKEWGSRSSEILRLIGRSMSGFKKDHPAKGSLESSTFDRKRGGKAATGRAFAEEGLMQ